MSNVSDGVNKLVLMADAKGYLTFNDIMDVSDALSLSVSDVDRLSEAIQLRGIIVYESEPSVSESKDEMEDYSRVDYEAIFSEIVCMSENLKDFIDQVKELPEPQYGEVQQLTAQTATGNSYARERLISIYIRNALKIALSMTKRYDYDIEDAVSASLIGLCTAADRYDPNGFSTFQPYASMWIQQHIQRECRPKWVDFYFPAHYLSRFLSVYNMFKEHSCSQCSPGRTCPVLVAEIASKEEISDEEARDYLDNVIRQFQHLSLDELDVDNCDALPPHLIDSSLLFDSVVEKQLTQTLKDVLGTLTPREEEILKMRNGFTTGDPLSLEQIGTKYGLTRERIRQIEEKALRKLRHPSRSKKLKDYW